MKDFKEINRKIEIWGEMLEKTEGWWVKRVVELNEKYAELKDKFDKEPDLDGEVARELETIEAQIRHLYLKSQWELKEIEKFKKYQKIVSTQMESDILNKLSLKVKRISSS